jgi:hypothetical protein
MSGDGVRVEPSQLEGKADEISTEISDSSGFPSAPCVFTFVQAASAQVQSSAITLKSFVASGNREASNLAIVLRTAAGVYRSVDERARAALDHDPPLAVPSDPVPVNAPLQPPVPAVEAPRVQSMPGGDAGGYMDPKAAAQIIHSGNPAPMRNYADDARRFANTLLTESDRFSLNGVDWHGTGAQAAGDALGQHQTWLTQIADQYKYLADQAEDIARAQEKWAAAHPTVEEIEQAERAMQQAIQNKDRVALHIAQEKYAELVRKSEEVLVSYSADVTGKGLLGIPKPPSGAAPVKPVTDNGDPRMAQQPDPIKDGAPQQPGTGNGSGAPQQPTGAPSPTAQPMSAQQPAAQHAAGGSPSGGGAPAGGGAPSGVGAPSGGMPGGLPGGGPSKGTPRLPAGPSLRPAAHGGGAGSGGAGGGGGRPSMPLSPAVGAETVAPTAPAHAASASPGAAATGAAAGGAMGGMAPMGHGAGHNQGKEKRRDPNLAPDEDLYTEDRPWTEAVIGNRRRRDVADGKESK